MMQQTFVILKPDCLRKGLEQEVLSMIEAAGLSILATKRIQKASTDLLFAHYEVIGQLLTRLKKGNSVEGEQIFDQVIERMQSGPIVAVLVEAEDVATRMRVLAGATRPWEAGPETIRGKYGLKDPNAPIENVVHASADADEAEREIALWFPELS